MQRTQLTTKQQLEIQQCFSLYDKDGDGKIGTKELPSVLRALGLAPSEVSIREYIQEADPRRTGQVGVQEVTAIVTRPKKRELPPAELLRDAFRVFDKGGKGFMPANDLRKILTTLGEELSPADAEELIREAGLTPEGLVNYERLIRLMTTF